MHSTLVVLVTTLKLKKLPAELELPSSLDLRLGFCAYLPSLVPCARQMRSMGALQLASDSPHGPILHDARPPVATITRFTGR